MLILQPGEVFAEHYRLTRLIDTGGFADVWEAVFLSAGNTVALKIYPRLDEEGGKNIENEYRNQADLSHSHLLIARYFGRHNGYPFLEMRYCSGGNAAGLLGSCDERELARCCYHIASALEYLHENNIVHQDIKPNNFLLDGSGNYYLADLGLSLKVRQTIKKFTMSGTAQKSSFTGLTPPAYRAFELYDRTTIGEQPVKASDIWALGASLYEMATGNMPFGEFGGLTQQRDPQPPSLPGQFSSQLNAILSKCLAKETWERPKASELAMWAHSYLQKKDYGLPTVSAATVPMGKMDGVSKTDEMGTVAEGKKTGGAAKATVAEGKGTIAEGGGNFVDAGSARKRRPVGLYVLLVVVVLGGLAWAWARSGSGDHKDGSKMVLAVKTDSPKVVQGTKTGNTGTDGKGTDGKGNDKKVGAADGKVGGTDGKGNDGKVGAADGKGAGAIKDPGTPPPAPEIVTTVNPSVGDPPKSGMISISKIERAKDYLKVYFSLTRQSTDDGNAGFSIYGPEKKSNCFFVVADGRQYRLLRISPSGTNLKFGTSKYFNFFATFEKIPEQARLINIIEGEDRDRMDQNYWTFREVHVK